MVDFFVVRQGGFPGGGGGGGGGGQEVWGSAYFHVYVYMSFVGGFNSLILTMAVKHRCAVCGFGVNCARARGLLIVMSRARQTLTQCWVEAQDAQHLSV